MKINKNDLFQIVERIEPCTPPVVLGPFQAKQDFDTGEAREEFMKYWDGLGTERYNRMMRVEFHKWLTERGCLRPISCKRINL